MISTSSTLTLEPSMTSEVIFAENVLASLRRQRSLTSPFCDVLVRCGNVTLATHGSVLAAVSRFFEKILVVGNNPNCTSLNHQKLVDLTSMFVGIESHFPEVIDSLYLGRLVWPGGGNQLLKTVYENLELKVSFVEDQALISDLPPQNNQMVVVGTQDIVLTTVALDQGLGSDLNLKPRPGKEVRMDISVCPKCDLLFMSKEEFLSHKSCHCARKIICQTCGATFPRVQTLLTHLIEVRHGEMECSACSYSAKSQKDLEGHLNRHVQVMDKPYFCTHCEARFSTRKRWLQHLPKHSTEAPFVCGTCGKAFKWKHALTAHEVIHSSEKKFLCQDCGFSTSHVSTLRFHNRMHAGNLMKCDVQDCTFQTTRKANLVQHQLTHSKEKPHQCEVCGRSFSLAKNMRRHARQHDLTASTYVCTEPDCSFSSLRSDKFYEHVKKYHLPDNPTQAPPSKVETFVVPITTSTTTSNASRLEKSPFNVINPPNKTVIDTMHGTFSDTTSVPIEEPSDDLEQGKIMVVDDLSDSMAF